LPFCKLTLKAKKPDFKPYPKQLKTIGDHLKKRRLDLNLPQKEVAKRLQATICTYRNWEKNRSNPSLPFIPRIIKFLGYVPYETSGQDFGKQIAAKRRLLGLRQKDLACLMGVDPCTIRSWEKGRHKPNKAVYN
jgi:transcriptional regulator with XRE-family HTH domain